mmetsp:Transcript_15886/g.34520  ORF Transcript_15886/g.34520 Transcript_15886/m.34520 type:complete len:356 (-) Transcript_15886:144-1211(-)
MTASPSYRPLRTPLILLSVLSACTESFATTHHAIRRAVDCGRVGVPTRTSTSRGLLGGCGGGHSRFDDVLVPSTGLHLNPRKPFADVFRVGRGGSDEPGDTGASIVSGPSDTSTVGSSTSALLATSGGGSDDIEAATSSGSGSVSESKLGPNAPPPGLIRRLLPWFPWHRLPDLLTYIRCLAIPLLVVLYYLPNVPNGNIINSVLFAGASITDWLDGYLARRWDITSAFGAFLDPVADKLMVSTALILLSGTWGAVVAIPSAIILAREIAVSALREWMAQRGLRDSVKVGFQGKVKTAATMLSLSILLLVPEGTDSIFDACFEPAMAMLFLSAIVTITSGSVYFKAAAPVLMGKE